MSQRDRQAESRTRGFRRLAVAVLAAALALPALASAAEAPPKLWRACETGSGAGQCLLPRGITTSSAPGHLGHLYVADQGNSRIDELTAWGRFVRAWGWDVVKSGPDDNGTGFEVCVPEAGDECKAGLSGPGAGQLSNPQGVAVDSAGDVFVVDQHNHRVQKFGPEGHFLAMAGDDVVSAGPDNSGSDAQQSLTVKASAGSYALTATVAEGVGATQAGSPTITGLSVRLGAFHPGDLISGPGIPAATTVQSVGAGTLTLSANATTSVPRIELTATETASSIPFDASHETLEAALNGLPGFGAGAVVVAGGPESPSESKYQLTFSGGAFKSNYVVPLVADPSGLTAGEKTATVQTTAPGGGPEVCRAAAADVCKEGVEGAAPGEFGPWSLLGSYIAVDTDSTPTASDDTLYIGDGGRIQRCDAELEGCAVLPDPEGLLAATKVSGLAVVRSGSGAPDAGRLFAIHGEITAGKEAEPNALGLNPATGAKECEAAIEHPGALATDRAGDLYAIDAKPAVGQPQPTAIVFGADCKPGAVAPFGKGELTKGVTAIATGQACLGEGADVYVANAENSNSFVQAYGPPPDDPECPPPPSPPSIDAQWAASVGSAEATLRAQINPHYWSGSTGTTTYYVQYATAACVPAKEHASEEDWGAACVKERPATPGAALGGGVVNEDVVTAVVSLPGLAPATAYRYRFAADNDSPPPGGVEVFGVGGKPGEDGRAASLTTYPSAEAPNTECPNQALRTGFSASLPDCRAYEMVSPLDKEGGDIAVRIAGSRFTAQQDQSAASGEALTYSSYRAFGGAQSAPFSTQYIARRGAGGWSSQNISPPQEGESVLPSATVNLDAAFKSFSPELDEAWLNTFTEPVLAPGGQPELANVYRRDDATGEYQACTSAKQEGLPPPEDRSGPKLLATSADGRHAVFRVEARMTPNAASSANEQLYECTPQTGGPGGLALVSVLPDGVASELANTAGTANTGWGVDLGRAGSYREAVSGDGQRVYWSASPPKALGAGAPGTLYLRLNSTAPEESKRVNGAASGVGDTVGPAAGEGRTAFKKAEATEVTLDSGSGPFSAGQPITDSREAIPPGTTIQAVAVEKEEEGKTYYKLTLSAQATGKAGKEDELKGEASATLANVKADSGAFQAGQQISGPAIPFGATIESCSPACGEGATSLTLSAKATATETAGALEASSECEEADVKACTVDVSRLVFEGPAQFLTADPQGGEALFNAGQTLYRFDVGSGPEPKPQASPVIGGFEGLLGTSEDLSRIYLLSTEATAGEEAEGAVKGKPNLYLDEGGAFTFVAGLSGVDANGGSQTAPLFPVNVAPYYHTALATPSGDQLAFMSNSAALAEEAGYDNTDQASGEPDAEIYRYDATTGKLACISCNPAGARPSGRKLNGSLWAAAKLPTWENSLYATRSLSKGGNRVFFESYEPLLPQDTDGVADVYEWETAGAGDCKEGKASYISSSGGCLGLISSGKGATDAEFIDASTEGRDVFIRTDQSLVPQDPGLFDIYDARELGGFPVPNAPARACEGEACQSPPVPPNHPTPATSVPAGEGNIEEAKPKACSKGKVKKNGRCVAKHQKKKAHRKHKAKKHRKRAHKRHHTRSAAP